jgi:hypothetical protein
MYRKISLIILVAVLFAVLLFIQPWKYFQSEDQTPTFYDRLPISDNIGRSDILSLSATMSTSLYHYQSPLREFLSPEFLLSQAKNYGLDVQSSVYFFADDKESKKFTDLGIMVMVLDSSKIGEGIKRFQNLIPFRDTTVHSKRAFVYGNRQMYITYGSDWFLFYTGPNFEARLKSILTAKKNEITADWRTFLNNFELTRHNVVMRSFSPKLRSRGIQEATITAQNDSNSITFFTELKPFDSVSFSLREGYQFKEKEFTKRLINLHLDVTKVKRNSKDPIYALLTEFGKKVSFPVDAFLDTWTGDVAFRNGGTYLLQEQYIESELDENFNISEVVKTKEVKISGVSGYLGVSQKGKRFLRSLYRKGIITEDGDRIRFLFSPPLNLKTSDSSYLFYSSNYKPELFPKNQNNGIWTISNTQVYFFLDSTSAKSIYGRIQLPLDEIFKK